MGDSVSRSEPPHRRDMAGMTMDELMALQREFVAERNWRRFHTPSNLAIAVAVEAAELLEHFKWVTADEPSDLSAETIRDIGDEMADVFLFLLSLSDALGIDLAASTLAKLDTNRLRWPPGVTQGEWVPRERGSAKSR